MNFEDCYKIYIDNIENHKLIREEFNYLQEKLNHEISDSERELLNIESDNLRQSKYFNEPSFDSLMREHGL